MKVVSLSRLWKDDLRALLDPELDFVAIDGADHAAVARALPPAEVLITTEFTKAMANVATSLQLLVCPAAGTEGIDRAALPEGVKLVRGSGHEIPMAEYVIGALVALRQHLLDADSSLRNGEWKYGFFSSADSHDELYGSALGLVGFGGIGQAVAQRACAFGMRCAAVTMHPEKRRQTNAVLEFVGGLGSMEQVDRLVAWSDELVLCCELSDVTRGLVDARRLSLMKRSALLVNVSRGAVAEEKDLYEALARRTIAGAALDVWYLYPPENAAPSRYPFWELPNVLMTPHSSAWSRQARRRRGSALAATINEFARAGEQTTS
jgi:phosphoglycerate dehydrogenase-like enzyme